MKFYLVFYSDKGNREDCNVYYSWLTQAGSKQAAINKVAADIDEDASMLEAEYMKLIA